MTEVCNSFCRAPPACSAELGRPVVGSLAAKARYFARLNYSACLVQVHFSGFTVVKWAQTSL